MVGGGHIDLGHACRAMCLPEEFTAPSQSRLSSRLDATWTVCSFSGWLACPLRLLIQMS